MPNYINSSPWTNQIDDLGAVFGRLMLNMAQLRALEAQRGLEVGVKREELGLKREDQLFEREKFTEGKPLREAQTSQATASAAKDTQEAERLKLMLAEALKMGLAERGAFAPPVDMSQGPTIDAAKALSLGDFIQSRGILTGINPSVLAQAVAPVEANKDTIIGDPKTGREIFRGPASPPESFNLGPQAGRYNTEGARLAFNPAQRLSAASQPDPTLQLSRIMTGMDAMERLGLDENTFVQGGVTNYVPTPAFSNLQQTLDPLAKAILESFQKGLRQNAPQGQAPAAVTGTTNSPVRVNTKAERDALAPGTQYIGPDGKTAVKQ